MATVRTITLERLIIQADPEFNRDKHRQEEYRFSNGRVFIADPDTRGAYAEED